MYPINFYQLMTDQGYSGSINEMLYKYYGENEGTGDTLNEREYNWLGSLGFLQPTLNERWYAYLNSLGLTGGLSQMQANSGFSFFSLMSLFANDGKGLLYVPSDISSLSQDSAGTTPVTSGGQPVGMMLDKRLGLVRGVEVIDDGGFNNPARWNALGSGTPNWVVAAGVATAEVSTSASRYLAYVPGGTVADKVYEFAFTILTSNGVGGVRFGNGTDNSGAWTTAPGPVRFVMKAAGATPTNLWIQANGNWAGSIDNISVRELPGNHATQPTAINRSVLHARVNLLTKTEDFTDAAWVKSATTVTPNAADPNGGTTAFKVEFTGGNVSANIIQANAPIVGDSNRSYWIRSDVATTIRNRFTNNGASAAAPVLSITTEWQKLEDVRAGTGTGLTNVGWQNNVAGDSAAIYIWHPQLETGSVATRYQRVNTATDYDPVGFLKSLSLDGTDDGYTTADFAAGTLGSNMDYFVAIKRDADDGNFVLGTQVLGNAPFFGAGGSDPVTPASIDAGTPTYFLNGVEIPGGTGLTIQQFGDAIPVGVWSIVELHNLDLSLWTAFKFGNSTSFELKGSLGTTVLCPAQSNDMRARIRNSLANSVGMPPPSYAVAIGDSTIAAYFSSSSVPSFMSSQRTIKTIAVPGDTIAMQKTAWLALTERSEAKWVVIQVGLNDVLTTEATAPVRARLQDLVDTVIADAPQAKVLISQMSPCRGALITVLGATDGPIAYQKWLDLNTSIAGGANPITGVDGRITSHVAIMNDGAGNLKAIYDEVSDGIHPNNAGRQVVAQAWEDGLTAAGITP